MNPRSTETLAKEEDDRYTVPGLKRGLMILQLFDQTRTGLGLSEIARRIEAPRSSTFRLVYTLESLGFLEKSGDGNLYRLSSGVLGLGFSYLSSIKVVQLASDPLSNLRDRTSLSANLAVLDGNEIVHLVCVPSRQAFTANVHVGTRRPAYATPMGRVLLCEHSGEKLAQLYPEGRLKQITKATPATLEELEAQLAQDRAKGYVVSHGSYTPGGCSVASPIRDADGRIVASINIVGPNEGWKDGELEGWLKDEVIETANDISHRLGFR